MGKARNFKLGGYIHRVHPNKSPLKIWQNRERGRIQGLPNFFEVPPIISGTGKTTNFNFCTHILCIDRNKSPLQISGKVAGCVVRTVKTFQGTHILGASRGLLCDSSAVLLYHVLANLENRLLDKIIWHSLHLLQSERIYSARMRALRGDRLPQWRNFSPIITKFGTGVAELLR